jgi:hypothetical protein
LEFDVVIDYTPGSTEEIQVRMQNNIQSIFSRVRLLYGATPLEDIPYYNVLVRSLSEWTGTNQQGIFDQTSINEGIGGYTYTQGGRALLAETTSSFVPANYNVRQKYIHGIDTIAGAGMGGGVEGFGSVPNATVPWSGGGGGANETMKGTNPQRRYQIQIALGIFNQEKLIPAKFMASQLALEFTLANPTDCMFCTAEPSQTTKPTYLVKNVNFIPEILEFDASYDESFLRGLQSGGVPIKFSTWNHFQFSNASSNSVNLQIQERSRSVKALFTLQRSGQSFYTTDSGASFFNTHSDLVFNFGLAEDVASTFQEYQYRIGGRYMPAQPVQCSTEVGGNVSNGGAEAWVEMSKALNILGDYRLSSSVDTTRWAVNTGVVLPAGNLLTTTNMDVERHPEYDYTFTLMQFSSGGIPIYGSVTNTQDASSGTAGACMFGMAIDLETSNGLEISGLNAEEQSDISLIARFSKRQADGFNYDVFTYIDSMIVLRENNVRILLTLGIGTYPVRYFV